MMAEIMAYVQALIDFIEGLLGLLGLEVDITLPF